MKYDLLCFGNSKPAPGTQKPFQVSERAFSLNFSPHFPHSGRAVFPKIESIHSVFILYMILHLEHH